MSRFIGILLCLLPALLGAPVHGAPHSAPVILVMGDSISAGYGIAVQQGWVSLLSARLKQEGYVFQVVNASVSGETTTGGLERLPRALSTHQPAIVIVELGGNDGLRGLPLDTTRANLDAMVALAARDGRRVLVLGMRMPANYGERYTSGFAEAYTAVARRHHAALVPFLLQNVAENAQLMQADGLHPTERGQPILLDNVWPELRPLLQSATRK
jgi:acyl-CoA thioesterase-1